MVCFHEAPNNVPVVAQAFTKDYKTECCTPWLTE